MKPSDLSLGLRDAPSSHPPGVPEGRATTAKASTNLLPPSVPITTRVNCRELTRSAEEAAR